MMLSGDIRKVKLDMDFIRQLTSEVLNDGSAPSLQQCFVN